jgi:hypothetical protein
MSARSLLLIASISALAGGLGCATGGSPTSAGDDQRVLVAVLNSLLPEQCQTCLLESMTIPSVEATGMPAFERDLVARYIERNRAPRELRQPGLPPRFRLISPSSVSRYFANGPREGWDRIRAEYGDRVALLRIGLPAYAKRGNRALVSYSYDAGPVTGETNYVILARRGGTWQIETSGHLATS